MSSTTTVTVADILELRADGLAEEEIWSLLCQAVQTLQDLFLSEKIYAEEVVPLVSPNTLGLGRHGAVLLFLVTRIHPRHEPYLAPEYDSRRKFSNGLDWEKMWVYSLGRTLSFALKTKTPSESLLVLNYMTTKNPGRRATLMSLLNIISDHCKTNLPLKPSSHLVMEMYKEVLGSPPQCLLPLNIPDVDRVVSIEDGRELQFRLNSTEKKSPSSTSSESGSLGSSIAVKRNPVHRAPSRLYRGPSTDSATSRKSRSVLPSACVGPEFVIRGMESPKVVHVGDGNASHRRALTVVLLTGQKIRVTCDPRDITCGKLFEVLVRVESIEDNYIFGLASTINGDFVFVPFEMKLHKVAPCGWKEGGKEDVPNSFFLYVRVRFFLPSLWGFRNGRTKHLMYLQLRRILLEQQIKCGLPELLTLGGLALQAEFGDFDEKEHGSFPYFLLEHYLPEEVLEEKSDSEARLREQHKSRRGLDPALAEEIFIERVQGLPEYGSHHYTALWVRKSVSIPMWVTVNPEGVFLYEKKKKVIDRRVHEAFVWKNIQKLSCNENFFRLVSQDVRGQKVTSYKLRMDKKKSFFLFRLASFHHQFFLKLRIELSPLHALSKQFGIGEKKENKNVFHLEGEAEKSEKEATASRENIEERQNKENENPMDGRKEKRVGVKMGVSVFNCVAPGAPERKFSFSDAYVIDSSVASSGEKFAYDLHESLPTTLAEEWEDVSWEEERLLRKVSLSKDKYGSFGLEIVEGSNGGLFVENVLKRERDEEIRRGDQLVSVNGICLLNLNYSEALNILRNAGNQIEILLSRSCKAEEQLKPLEREYLKNIRYETANEAEDSRSGLRFPGKSLIATAEI